jgi:hypothetical protein
MIGVIAFIGLFVLLVADCLYLSWYLQWVSSKTSGLA